MNDPFANDDEFLRYVETHAETDRCLFHMDHIKRFHDLAGVRLDVPDYMAGAFRSMDTDYVKPLLKTARAKLKAQPVDLFA